MLLCGVLLGVCCKNVAFKIFIFVIPKEGLAGRAPSNGGAYVEQTYGQKTQIVVLYCGVAGPPCHSKKVRCPNRFHFFVISYRVNGPFLVTAQRSGGSLETPPPLARDKTLQNDKGL